MTTPLEPMNQPSGTTLLDPREREQESDDDLFHYVRKDAITESAVMGTMVTALCGAQFPVTKTPKPGSPVCPACKEMLEMLKAFGPGGDGGGGGES